MAERIDRHQALMQVRVWREGERIHVVGADPDLPSNGIHWNLAKSKDLDSYKNLDKMLNVLQFEFESRDEVSH